MEGCPECMRREALKAEIRSGYDQLTLSQQQTALYIAKGLTAGEVGALLHRSRHTVRDHLKTVYEKMAVSTQEELAIILTKLDLL